MVKSVKAMCLTTVALGTLLSAGAAAAEAIAAKAEPNDAASDSSEIIVTAQKRAESIDHVPIAISVLTQSAIRDAGVGSTQKLEIATPGLVFGNANGFAQPYIRGIGTDLVNPGQESPVGFYIDGVYLAFQSSLLQEFGDIERVEVLKGPQGTLYGRNTTGGAINIITRDPEGPPTLEGQVTFGSRGRQKYLAYAAGSLSDTLSASVSGLYSKHDGFFRVINQNRRSDNLDERGVRGKLKFEPSSDLTITLSADYLRKHDQSATVYTTLVGSNAVPVVPGAGPSFIPRQTYADGSPGFRKLESWGLNGTIRWKLGSVDLTSITGYRHDKLLSATEGDNTALPLQFFQSNDLSKSFTQEVQLTSQTGSPLQWIAGLFYLKSDIGFDPVRVWVGAPNTGPSSLILGGDGTIESYAGFGQATYKLTDAFSITAGLRYSHEKRVLTKQYLSKLNLDGLTYTTFNLLDPTIRPLLGAGPFPAADKAHSVDPKITVQYDANGQLLYATFSKGFKSGSYNLISVGDPGPLEPEKITAFEIGGKHRLNESGIRLSWSLFHYKYKNIQINVNDPNVGGTVSAQNAASTTNKGADVNLTLPIVPRVFTATLSAEYLDAKYTKFPNASTYNIVGGLLDTLGTGDTIARNASGNRAIRSPKLTLTAQGVLTIPVGDGKINTTGTLYHNSGFFFDAGNLIRQKSYQIVNLNVGYSSLGDRFGLAVFANNLFNKTVIQGVLETPFGISAGYNDPSIYGVTASFKF